MRQPPPTDEERLEARLVDLAARRRAAEETPFSDLEAYVRGELEPPARARVEAAATLSPTVASELKALESPDQALRAAALRGFQEGWRAQPDPEPDRPSLLARLAAWLWAPRGVALALAVMVALVILPRIFVAPSVPSLGIDFPSAPTLAEYRRFQEGQSATFTIGDGDATAPVLLFDLGPGGIAWQGVMPPRADASQTLEHVFIPDGAPHILLALSLDGAVDMTRLSEVLGALDLTALEGDGEAALRQTLQDAGFDVLSLELSEPFVTVPL